MSRHRDAPWVVLGMPEKNKLLFSHPDEKRAGRYETLICERKPGTEEPEFVYMRLMWCTREAVQTFRDHLDRLLEMWEEDHELDDHADEREGSRRG